MTIIKQLLTGFGAVILFALIVTYIVAGPSRHKSNLEKAEATVMITNLQENHGGTGVILKSTSNSSEILTNSHVCEVVKGGGVVKNDYKKGFVTDYYQSQYHDLCLIKTNTDFRVNTRISSEPPEVYSEASVSGHPKLMPTIITKGTFGQKQYVQVLTGFRPCTPEEAEDPQLGFICMLAGGIPVVKTYEAQFIGATIQPGNSGSAVYDELGEVAGLVFAGSGDLAYAMIVPQEYVYNFVNSELKLMPIFQKPDVTVSFGQEKEKFNSQIKRFKAACAGLSLTGQNNDYCKLVNTDLVM